MRVLAVIVVLALAAPALAQMQEKSTGSPALDTGRNIVEAPLKDLNIIKPKVPPLLLSVMDRPYATDGLNGCPAFASAIKALDGVLGPDVDSKKAIASPQGPSQFALGAAQDLAGSIIPGGGLIRRISGASKEQKRAAAAVYAGSVRRAFLKGTARARGCRV